MGKNRKNKKQAYRMIASCNGDQLFRATCTNGRVSYKSLLEESPSRPDLVGSYAGPLVDPAWVSKQDSCGETAKNVVTLTGRQILWAPVTVPSSCRTIA